MDQSILLNALNFFVNKKSLNVKGVAAKLIVENADLLTASIMTPEKMKSKSLQNYIIFLKVIQSMDV